MDLAKKFDLMEVSSMEKLDKIKKTISKGESLFGYNMRMTEIKMDDIDWLVEQAEKTEKYKKALITIAEDTNYMEFSELVTIADEAMKD